MSRESDSKFIQDSLLGKQDNILFTTDYNKITSMGNRSIAILAVAKDSISSGNPSNDEMQIYTKFDNRLYKVSLSEVS